MNLDNNHLMLTILLKAWPLILFIVVVTVFITLGTRNIVKNTWKSFMKKSPLIKKYWLFVAPFSLLTIIAYILVLMSFSGEELTNYLSILSQATTLIFAIFVGYFAFVQVIESRFDKLSEKALTFMQRGSYLRAKRYYEQAHIIAPNDFTELANLMELYLLIGDNVSFEEKIERLESIILEPYEEIVIRYLKATKFLLGEDIGSARSHIAEIVDYIQENPFAIKIFSWDFRDIKKSHRYTELTGECRNVLDNLISYLGKQLSEEDKVLFESGNYLITRPVVVNPA